MATAKTGDHVRVHYTGKLSSGEQFDTSQGRDPLEFTLGANQVIPGFENGIVGMDEGDTKTVEIAKDNAYGDYRDDLIVKFKKEDFPEELTPEVGKQVELSTQDGKRVPTVIKDIQGEEVLLDANHPLAGKDLVFDIELVKVLDEEEKK